MDFYLVQNQKENCHHDHIPLNLKGNGNIVFSARSEIFVTISKYDSVFHSRTIKWIVLFIKFFQVCFKSKLFIFYTIISNLIWRETEIVHQRSPNVIQRRKRALRKQYYHFLSHWMGYDRDVFLSIVEPYGIPFGSKSKGKLSWQSYPIQCERKW